MARDRPGTAERPLDPLARHPRLHDRGAEHERPRDGASHQEGVSQGVKDGGHGLTIRRSTTRTLATPALGRSRQIRRSRHPTDQGPDLASSIA